MSVLIKEMTMPDMCSECDFVSSTIMHNGKYICECPSAKTCGKNVTEAARKGIRDLDCQLVEVPKPYGRLIDEAIILEMIRKSMGIKDLSFLYHAEKSIVNEIYHAPTVIEAEDD